MTQTRKGLKAAAAVIMALLVSLLMFMVPADASALTMNKSGAKLAKGYAMQLKVSGTSSAVSWSSSDKSVATVSSKGKVVGKKKGTAYITAKSGGSSVSCVVEVVNGKISASTPNVSLNAGDQRLVTITAKGSHALKVKSSNKSVVTAKWASSEFTNDKANLRLTALSAGTATVKVYMTKYNDIYVNLYVTVMGGNTTLSQNGTGTLRTNVTSLNVNVDNTATFTLYSADQNLPTAAFSDNTIATLGAGTWTSTGNGQYSMVCTVRGLKAGTTYLTLTDRNNASNFVKLTITVGGAAAAGKGTYYTVYDDQNTSRYITNTDRFISFYDSVKRATRYVLVPGTNAYDVAQFNSAVAKATGSYTTYTVYADYPNAYNSSYYNNSYYNTTYYNSYNGSSVQTFTATIPDVQYNNGYVNTVTTNVTRYILVPSNYDSAQVNYIEASYRKVYEYGVIYSSNPLNSNFTRKSSNDKVYTFTCTKNGQTVTRYLVYPSTVTNPQVQYQSILSAYGVTTTASTTQMGAYYSVYTAYNTAWEARRTNSDIVQTVTIGGRAYYVLCPYNYEIADVNTAVAKYTKTYQYNTIYANNPTLLNTYTDWLVTWTKTVNGKTVTHYAFFPDKSDTYQQMSYNLQVSDGVVPKPTYNYYEILSSRPITTGGDVLKTWVNTKLGTPCYMVVPANYDPLKVNDIKVANGSQYELYHVYTNMPSIPSSAGYTVVEGYYTANGAFVHAYCYVPVGYEDYLVSRAFAGYEV